MAHDHRIAFPAAEKPGSLRPRSEWRAAGMLFPYLWEFRTRVVIALAFLTGAKLANVGVPLIMKEVVDSLDARTAVLVVPFALLAAYGILRFSTTLFAELRDVIFVKVTQRAFAACVKEAKPCVQALIDANGALNLDNEMVNWQLVQELMSDKFSREVALGIHDDGRMKADYELVRDYVGLDKPFDIKTVYTNEFLDRSIKMTK